MSQCVHGDGWHTASRRIIIAGGWTGDAAASRSDCQLSQQCGRVTVQCRKASSTVLINANLVMRPRFHFQALCVLGAVALGICPLIARGDCSLTTTGNVPLVD